MPRDLDGTLHGVVRIRRVSGSSVEARPGSVSTGHGRVDALVDECQGRRSQGCIGLDGETAVGIVDIGSNSVRLVIYDAAVRAPTPWFNEKESCRLGQQVASSGVLDTESITCAIEALRRFRAILGNLNIKHVRAFATAAAREADNGDGFLAAAEIALGAPIQLLTGEHEARLVSLGIAMGFAAPNGVAGDLGGGSLELVDVVGDAHRNALTLPLGGLRLIDLAGERVEKAVAHVDQQIARLAWGSLGRGRPFYAVGGSWRALAKLHMLQSNYALPVLHGYSISCREAQRFCDHVRRGKKLRGWEHIPRNRREVMPYGALVLDRLLQRLDPSEVIFSVYGIREGMLFDLLKPEERSKDPLLSFCADFAELRSRDPAHAVELMSWTDQLFSLIGFADTPEERRLRHAACLLSDVGWRLSPDFRGEQSLNGIVHSAMTGIDHPGRMFLALTVFLRHVGPNVDLDTLGEPFKSQIGLVARDRRTIRSGRILAAAIRAAHMLSQGYAGIIDKTRFGINGGDLQLIIPSQFADLNGERLRRRFDSLARIVGLQPRMSFVDERTPRGHV